LDTSQLKCNSKSKIGLVVGLMFVVIVVLFVIIIIAIVIVVFNIKRKEEEKKLCVFKMNKSNIIFLHQLDKSIVTNKQIIKFEDEEYN